MIECSSHLHANHFVTLVVKDHKTTVNNQLTSLVVEVLLTMDMEQVNMNYSKKNIPLPNNKDVQQIFIEKMRTFLRNATLRVLPVINPNFKSKNKETYDFK